MIKKLLYAVVLSVMATLCANADEVRFTASAPEAVVSGEQFRVSYTVTTQKVRDFRAPAFEGFEELMGPSRSQQSSTSIINGQRTSTSTLTYTYVLMALKEGTYTLPGATITADGKDLTSNTLKIKVLPPDQTTGSSSSANSRSQGSRSTASASNGQISANDLFITATVNKSNVYEQEALLLTYKVYFNVNLRELTIKMPDLKGFHTQEVDLKRGQPTLEHYNGRNYQTLVWSQYVLFPQQTGKLEIPSINFDATVAVRTRQSMDPFEAFFNGGASYVDVRKTISTPKLTVNVSPLPSGKPESFSGGVGEFSLASSISTTELKANEAVTLKLEIAGTGNMKLMNIPEVAFPQDFETYDPKVENNFSLRTNGLSGKKVIEYLAIPRHAGTYTIPPVEFSYFDIKSKSYKTLQTEPYELHVAKGTGESDQVMASFTNKEDVKQLGQDIRYIKTGEVTLQPRGKFFLFSGLFWCCWLLPTVALILAVILYRKRLAEGQGTLKGRTKNANKVAVKRLKLAAKLLKESKKEAFYDEVLKALWGYVGDKLNMPVSVLSKDNIEQELAKCSVDKALTDEFIQVLGECEFARYAPTAIEGGMDKVYSAAVDVISKMENTIKRLK